MLTPGEDMEIEALKRRGWTISAIARDTGRDRKTVRVHLNGEREAGVRRRPVGEVDPFDRFEPYVRQRLTDDPHVWATALFDEVATLGYERAYPTFTRQLRDRQLRPHCEPCASSTGEPMSTSSTRPGRDAVGLARASRHPVGSKGVSARRVVVAFEPVPWLVLRGR
jgi:transposase